MEGCSANDHGEQDEQGLQSGFLRIEIRGLNTDSYWGLAISTVRRWDIKASILPRHLSPPHQPSSASSSRQYIYIYIHTKQLSIYLSTTPPALHNADYLPLQPALRCYTGALHIKHLRQLRPMCPVQSATKSRRGRVHLRYHHQLHHHQACRAVPLRLSV